MKKLTVKNKLVHVDVFIFHIDNNLTDLKHHFKSDNFQIDSLEIFLFQPRREKIGFLHMRKQRRKTASR